MKFKTRRLESRGIVLTRNENICNFVAAELKRVIVGEFNVIPKFHSGDSIYIFHCSICGLGLEMEIVKNIDEYSNPDDLVSNILIEIRKKIDKRIFR